MTERSKKGLKQTPSRDPDRQTRVLLEDMRSQFNVVAEQYGSINHKLDLQEVLLESVKMEVQIVKSKVGAIDAKVNTLGRELDTVKEAALDNSRRLDRVEQKLDATVEKHEARLKAVESRIG